MIIINDETTLINNISEKYFRLVLSIIPIKIDDRNGNIIIKKGILNTGLKAETFFLMKYLNTISPKIIRDVNIPNPTSFNPIAS